MVNVLIDWLIESSVSCAPPCSYSLTMDVHTRLRTESHQQVTGETHRSLKFHVSIMVRGKRMHTCRACVRACGQWVWQARRCNRGPPPPSPPLLTPVPPVPLSRTAGRFNERLVLSLASCQNCVLMDDELNVLPTSTHVSLYGRVIC